MKKQWEKRVGVTNYIYQCLVLDYSTEEMNANLVHDDFSLDQLDLIENIIINHESMIERLKVHLGANWSWARINMVDKAIMLTALGEKVVWKTPKVIIIDQALITAKHYNGDSDYRYINAVLDKAIANDE